MIDTHAHLFLEQFNPDREAVIKKALETGIKKMFLPNVDLSTLEALKEVARTYPEICFPMIGIHPCSVKNEFIKEFILYFYIKWKIFPKGF